MEVPARGKAGMLELTRSLSTAMRSTQVLKSGIQQQSPPGVPTAALTTDELLPLQPAWVPNHIQPLSTHEKIHSSEILVITCRTPGFKTGKRSVWKRANKGGVVNFKCNSFQPSENWSSDEDSTNKPLEGVYFLMDRHNS